MWGLDSNARPTQWAQAPAPLSIILLVRLTLSILRRMDSISNSQYQYLMPIMMLSYPQILEELKRCLMNPLPPKRLLQ